MTLPVVGAFVEDANAIAATSITLPIITIAGTNKCLIVGAATNDDSASAPTGATWDLTTPENLNAITNANNTNWNAAAFQLVNPTDGTNTVTISYGATQDDIAGYAQLLTGVDQTTPIGNTQTSTGDATSCTATVTGVNADTLVMDVLAFDTEFGTTITAGANQTEISNITSTGGFPVILGGSTQDGADGGVMSWSFNAADDFAFVAFAVNGISFTIEQEGFRGRNDNGTETTATWIAAQDIDISVAPDDLFRVRYLLNFTGDAPSTQYTLEIEEDGTGIWKTVTIEL